MGNLLNMSGGSLLGKGGLLPSGYKQLEYIENTSNAYIDTGVKPNQNTHIKLKARTYDWSVTFILFGVREKDTTNKYTYSLTFSYLNGIRWDYNGRSDTNIFLASNIDVNIDNIEASNVIKINNTVVRNQYTNFQLNSNLYLFNIQDRGNLGSSTLGTIYYCQLYAGATLIRNFIPCKNPQNVVGMYDTINGVFYSSPNGTAFVAGPEV